MNSKKKRKQTILIIDDVPDNLQVLGSILDKEGFDISPALNGKEGLRLAKNIRPNLILLDIMMPGMNGFEVLEELKKDKTTEGIPVIFLTAKVEKEDVVKGLQSGAVDYVTKPFNPEELLMRIRNQLTIQAYQKDIEKLSQKRKELLHVLCHDLANPLTAILGAIDIIEPQNEDEREIKQYIKKSADQGVNVINVVKKLEAAESKQLQMKMQPVILSEAIDNSLRMLRDMYKAKNITILNNVSDDLIVEVELTTFVNSVLNNILTNAIKFSYPESEIVIQAKKEPANGEEKGYTVLEIKDHGIGIPESIVPNLFDSSKTTHRDGTSGEDGTGFGMPLVKTFVNAYGGTITINSDTSEEQHGTSVLLRLKTD